jgi:trehalose utilization protein
MGRVQREVPVGLGSSQEGHSSWCPKQMMAGPCGTKKKREKGKREGVVSF